MSLEQKISEELKAAMKSGDKMRIDTIRSIRAGIIEFKKSGVPKEMEEEDELALLKTHVKRRQDAIELYQKGGRDDLAQREQSELKVIREFMPEEMPKEELEKIVSDSIAKTGAKDIKDLGKVMQVVMSEVKGRADGRFVNQIVRNMLTI
ncbi:MAG: GatB/YqeY domain-containing protein [Candidatus Kapaibacterium sp.]